MLPITARTRRPSFHRAPLTAALVVSVALAACTGSGGLGTQSAERSASAGASPASTTAGQASPGASARPADPDATAVVLDDAWATATLTNVRTGAPFRIADAVAAGKVVFIETMAIWCSNCRTQQVAATEAFTTLDPARVEWIAIDVETSETAEALARYSEQNGFPFTYAIADVAFARALVDAFGEVVLSPPSVNVIVIGTDGRVTHLRGHKSADDVRGLAAEHGA